ncbi:agmatinase [Methanosarcinaceae archaeon]|nr:agmatinase [Methanosarcinaceae archaeon]
MDKVTYKFLSCSAPPEEADVILFGAPYDGTVSFRPGTRFGPSAVRPDSYGLEMYSPYLDDEITNYRTADIGDLVMPFGDQVLALDRICGQVKEIIDAGKKPLMIGGEHLVTLGAVRALAEKYPDLHIIHLDAHTDLRDEFFDVSLSHATVLKKCYDILGDGRIFQFGIRSGERAEFEWAAAGHTYLHKHDLETLDEVCEKLKDKPVYITIDLDVFDPSVFPGTGTPEPGGITFKEMMWGYRQFCRLNHIVGADLVELAPNYDTSGVSTAVACKCCREMILVLNRAGKQ